VHEGWNRAVLNWFFINDSIRVMKTIFFLSALSKEKQSNKNPLASIIEFAL